MGWGFSFKILFVKNLYLIEEDELGVMMGQPFMHKFNPINN